MPNGPEAGKIIQLELDVPKETRSAVRACILEVLKVETPEFDFGGPVRILREHFKKVIAAITTQFPDMEVTEDGDGKYIVRKKAPITPDPERLAEDRADRKTGTPRGILCVKPTAKGEKPAADDDNRDNDSSEPWSHHNDGSWAKLRRNKGKARTLACKVNKKPGSGKSVYQVTVSFGSFCYRGENTGIIGEERKVLTLKALKTWMKEVDDRKSQ